MQIQQLFEKDINRSINGVVKVSQDDEALVSQELTEYVITTELARHFADFFENYTAAIDTPTDKMGVWITGFFGSGKSHFLKMLSYLLANKTVEGNAAIDYFEGKVEDPMVFSQMKRAASIPTETILFNIDTVAGNWKERDTARTALLRGFTRVFYDHLGFYGKDFKLARLERFVEDKGKTEEFRAAFSRVNGGNWLEDRESYDFYEDEIVEVLGEVLGMSEESARRFFESSSDEAVAPDALAAEIKRYVDAKAEEHGDDFRLIFLADEIGQFIGDDVNLMLNLQTLVQELGTQCQGRVWVMVTSQEAIDKVVKVQGDDFSKIQGRFNTRLTLSSSSVDEVIKRRVLEKTPDAKTMLSGEYDQQSSVLKNLFTFENAQSDLLGYANADDFQASYPFVAYQFKLMPKVFNEIRRHGNAGKHLASGERSMLSGFQESAQKVGAEDTNVLVPFWFFYDTLAKSLDHEIRQVIDRAEQAASKNQGLELQDVSVLKTLYLIHYIKDVPATINNLTIFMVDSMDVDKVNLREQVKASLDRLVRENYVARYGDTYTFLTDEEQDVEREIKNTDIDSASVIDRIKKIIFDGIYTKKKYRLGMSDFAFDAYVDDTLHGVQSDGMKLNVITAANELSKADPAELALRSVGQALIALRTTDDYYEVLANAAKIEKYVRMQNVSHLPETKQAIIRAKQKEAAGADREARQMIEAALVNADVAVNGRNADVKAGKAEAKLDGVLHELTGAVYTKAGYIGAPVEDGGVGQILHGSYQEPMDGANDEALHDMEQFLTAQAMTHQPTSMGDIIRKYAKVPYGWREADIQATVARLARDQKVNIEKAGAILSLGDSKTLAALTKRNEWDSTQIRLREHIDESTLNTARRLLRELSGNQAIPQDEDGVIEATRDYLQSTKEQLDSLLANEYRATNRYPGRDVVTKGSSLIGTVLESANDPHAFITAFRGAKDGLLDFSENYEDVAAFFPNQQRLFDDALELLDLMEGEATYLPQDGEGSDQLEQVATIVALEKPYRRIKDLNGLMAGIRGEHQKVLAAKRNDVLDRIKTAAESIREYATGKPGAEAAIASLETDLLPKRDAVGAARTVIQLEALNNQISKYRDDKVVAIDNAVDAQRRKEATAKAGTGGTPKSDPAPAPKVKTLRRSDVCPSSRLESAEDVDAYVADVKKKLMNAVIEYGAIRLKD